MVDGDLEALTRLEMECVVEGLGVQEHRQAVGLAHLGTAGDVPVDLAKQLEEGKYDNMMIRQYDNTKI